MQVLVVAEQLLVRSGLAALLATQDDLEIVAQVSGLTLADDLDLYQPDAVVLDLGYPVGEQNPTRLERLETLSDVPTIILVSGADDAISVVEATDEGTAYGLLLRETSPEMISAALWSVTAGLITIDPALASTLIVPEAPADEPILEALTPRETEVLQLLAEGLPNKQIAQQLTISPNTVKFHINSILTKLNAQSRTEAVVRATRSGLIIL
jgi:DNA-binding NarL/FixJ family response regulator